MTNTKLLEDYIERSGYRKSYIAKAVGLSSYGLSLKIRNKSEFKATEIEGLCTLLGISSWEERAKIFFANDVDFKSTSPAGGTSCAS